MVEVDHSIKIGDLSRAKVVAFSDHVSWTILIPAGVKRALMVQLRARGKSRTRATGQIFSAVLLLLVEDNTPQIGAMVIDTEYTGYEPDIEGMLLNYLRGVEPGFNKERLVFRQVGKSSPAHKGAISTHRGKGKVKPDRILKLEDFLTVLGWKQNNRGSLRPSPA